MLRILNYEEHFASKFISLAGISRLRIVLSASAQSGSSIVAAIQMLRLAIHIWHVGTGGHHSDRVLPADDQQNFGREFSQQGTQVSDTDRK